MPTVPVGICFVSRDDWPEYCRISTDIAADASYDKWLKKVEEICAGIKADGAQIIKVDTKPAELLAWCQARKLVVDRNSRAQYAAFRVMNDPSAPQ
jgi:hypothetical protein